MTPKGNSTISIRVQLMGDNCETCGQPITFVGREAWCCRELVRAADVGISSLNHVGVRLSHYVLKLRRAGLTIETVPTRHGGTFPGVHAVYILRSNLRVLEDNARAAA